MPELKNSNSIFKKITKNKAQEITTLFGSPCFIIDEEALVKRGIALQKALTSQYKNSIAAYSVKTQPLSKVIKRFYEIGFIPEVVSSDEFDLIEKLKLNNKGIIFNGPYKTDKSLKKALSLPNSIINCDHYDEIERISNIASDMGVIASIGLRVCDNSTPENWSRFGFALENIDNSNCDIFRIINDIKNIPQLKLSGIHCHIGTNIRDLSRFNAMSTNIAKLAEAILIKYGQTLDWIDLGGGLAGTSPKLDDNKSAPYSPYDLDLYAESIISPLKTYLTKTNNQTKLIFELGRSLVDYSTALISTIVGSRENSYDSQVLIADAGIHIAPTTRVYNHPIYSFNQNSSTSKKTSLLGPSCMQHDYLAENILLPELKYKDQILVDNLGAYNISRNNEFIHLKPSVILINKNNNYQILREKQKH
ncbi:diaminopimelate decarboxylase [Candidatus Francisella endociliophora]|uniref:Diaminopimelate decarboxylase n=1 Tax=Candidatus Francisella endociliophora TaxID=653937 RepID=A0A097EPL2_9GAMM|nr:rhizoferrin biosystnesis N-citrylornithine decarboxylase FslC [Francisella sp. FSC1006]AIT09514.1 diaminopimelate decarboxylase [Francisella sp. FSC1006]